MNVGVRGYRGFRAGFVRVRKGVREGLEGGNVERSMKEKVRRVNTAD